VANTNYIPKVGDVIRFVKDGVTYLRRVESVEDRTDAGFFRVQTVRHVDS
jgi:hypothetical protein